MKTNFQVILLQIPALNFYRKSGKAKFIETLTFA